MKLFQPKRLKRRNLKKFRLERESNPWPLRYRSNWAHQLSYQANWELVNWEFVYVLPYRSQRSWVRFPFKPEFFQVSSFQPLRLKHFHCDDLHIILVLCRLYILEVSAVDDTRQVFSVTSDIRTQLSRTWRAELIRPDLRKFCYP